MRILRVLLPLALLFVAVPAVAQMYPCGYCTLYDECRWAPGYGTTCHMEHYLCYSLCVQEGDGLCNSGPFAQESFSSGYRILSVVVEPVRVELAKRESVATAPKKLKKRT